MSNVTDEWLLAKVREEYAKAGMTPTANSRVSRYKGNTPIEGCLTGACLVNRGWTGQSPSGVPWEWIDDIMQMFGVDKQGDIYDLEFGFDAGFARGKPGSRRYSEAYLLGYRAGKLLREKGLTDEQL